MGNKIKIECDNKDIFKDVDMYIHSIELNYKPSVDNICLCADD